MPCPYVYADENPADRSRAAVPLRLRRRKSGRSVTCSQMCQRHAVPLPHADDNPRATRRMMVRCSPVMGTTSGRCG